jgi:hypothetical protein
MLRFMLTLSAVVVCVPVRAQEDPAAGEVTKGPFVFG